MLIVLHSGLDVRLQFDLDLEHKLDYCKVFDSNPEDTTNPPRIDRFLLRSVIVSNTGSICSSYHSEKSLTLSFY